MAALVRSAGGVVVDGTRRVALVKSKNSQSWLFPKGRVELGESDEDAARREILEEAGLGDLELIDDLGEFIRPLAHFEKHGYEEKIIRMFLFKAAGQPSLKPSMEIEETSWVPLDEVPERLGSPHQDWFARDRAWYFSVEPRLKEKILSVEPTKRQRIKR